MSAITAAQSYGLLRAAGATAAQATMLTAIGGAESGLDPAAVGDVGLENGTWGPSLGIWQVRTLKSDTGKGTSRDANHLSGNPAAQAAAAVAILKGQGLSAWSTYTSGAYQKFMGAAMSGAGAPASAQAYTGQNVGLGLGDLLQPWKIPGDLAGAAAGDAAGQVAGSIWSSVQPTITTLAVATAGLGLIVAGVIITSKPAVDAAREKGQQNAQQVGQLAALAA